MKMLARVSEYPIPSQAPEFTQTKDHKTRKSITDLVRTDSERKYFTEHYLISRSTCRAASFEILRICLGIILSIVFLYILHYSAWFQRKFEYGVDLWRDNQENGAICVTLVYFLLTLFCLPSFYLSFIALIFINEVFGRFWLAMVLGVVTSFIGFFIGGCVLIVITTCFFPEAEDDRDESKWEKHAAAANLIQVGWQEHGGTLIFFLYLSQTLYFQQLNIVLLRAEIPEKHIFLGMTALTIQHAVYLFIGFAVQNIVSALYSGKGSELLATSLDFKESFINSTILIGCAILCVALSLFIVSFSRSYVRHKLKSGVMRAGWSADFLGGRQYSVLNTQNSERPHTFFETKTEEIDSFNSWNMRESTPTNGPKGDDEKEELKDEMETDIEQALPKNICYSEDLITVFQSSLSNRSPFP